MPESHGSLISTNSDQQQLIGLILLIFARSDATLKAVSILPKLA